MFAYSNSSKIRGNPFARVDPHENRIIAHEDTRNCCADAR